MKKGILFVNLGSPDSFSTPDVRKYLREFLMDKYVIDIPYVMRWLLLETMILPKRPKESAHMYEKIWTEKGSPLIVISEILKEKVQQKIDIPVALGMRYGSLSIKKSLQELSDKGVDEILVIPLYPQYAMSTTRTVNEKVMSDASKYFPNIKLRFKEPFYKESQYIKALASSVKGKLSDDYEHLLFSYHGIPERHIYKTDPTKSHCKIDGSCCQVASKAHEKCYRHQCLETTNLVAKELGLDSSKYSVSFQSRLGQSKWLTPYTDETLEGFSSKNIKNIKVVTPAFVSDCLETLEEIAISGKELFVQNGGQKFEMIPCLNDNEMWVNVVVDWCESFVKS